MVLAVIKARDFQITYRLRRDAFTLLAVVLCRYPFSWCVVVAVIGPNGIARTPVEVGRLGKRIVETYVAPEGHHEQCLVDLHRSEPSSQNA